MFRRLKNYINRKRAKYAPLKHDHNSYYPDKFETEYLFNRMSERMMYNERKWNELTRENVNIYYDAKNLFMYVVFDIYIFDDFGGVEIYDFYNTGTLQDESKTFSVTRGIHDKEFYLNEIDNDLLKYDHTTKTWKNVTISDLTGDDTFGIMRFQYNDESVSKWLFDEFLYDDKMPKLRLSGQDLEYPYM